MNIEPTSGSSSNEPRKLTDDEITYIAEVIPLVISSDIDGSIMIRQQIVDHIKTQLQDTIITPLGIDDLRNIILQKYNTSLINPGSSVGMHATDSITQLLTQMSLDTKHAILKAGSLGVKRIDELINGTYDIKHPTCIVHFTEQVSFNQVSINKKRDMLDLRVADVVNDYEIDLYTNLVPDPPPPWYNLFYSTIRPKDKPDKIPKYIMRLYLKVDVMYLHYITMKDLSDVLENNRYAEKNGGLTCIYSPTSEGIMDIYPIESIIMSNIRDNEIITHDNISLIWLSSTVLPNLHQIQIKGITNIKDLFPMPLPVPTIVYKQVKDDNDPNLWYLIYNQLQIDLTGVKPSNLIELINITGTMKVDLSLSNSDRLAVRTTFDNKPLDKINELVKKFQDQERDFMTEQRSKGVLFPQYPLNDFMNKIYYVTALTTGSNISGLYARDDVDFTHTYSNNLYDILKYLGIEACRNYIIKEFIDLFAQDGQHVSYRHILLLADFITSRGNILQLIFSGMKRINNSAMYLSSYEHQLEVITKASLFGTEEKATSTAFAISTGQKIKSQFKITTDQQTLDKYKDKFLRQSTKVSTDQLNNTISTLDTITGTAQLTPVVMPPTPYVPPPQLYPLITPEITGSTETIPASLQLPELTYTTSNPPPLPPLVSGLFVDASREITSIPMEPISQVSITTSTISGGSTLGIPTPQSEEIVLPTLMPTENPPISNLPPIIQRQINFVRNINI